MVNTSTTLAASKKRSINSTASISSADQNYDLSEIKAREGKAAESKKSKNV